MNTNDLKKFAQESRKKLIELIGSRLEYVLNTDTPELREKSEQIRKLRETLSKTSEEQLIDKVAYTWFNRFMALRFMDANDYQPIGIRVLTPKDGQTLPELLAEAKMGHISEELSVNKQRIFDLLDGKIPSSNAQNEAYKDLLIGACNHLNKVFPFLFERINDYTELLLPDDLTSELSIIQSFRNGMSVEECVEVEIVGWLYQFYISEKNEELISSKKVYKKEELAPASQLFTPKWIVQYMVDNTLGQVWSEINPATKVTADLEFYIKPAYLDQVQKREVKSIEDVKFFEPCTGSGHILAYAFDVFYKVYEEQGYNPTEIPELIITKNLYGVDIDQRASQLASFVLLMKGRQKNRRFLRAIETKNIQPNISYYQDFEFDNKFKNATALGSLIRVDAEELKNLVVEKNSLFSERQEEVKKLYQLLSQRYDVVVTNPPYISSSRMEGSLKQYVEATYPETKSDLFATFILRCLELCNEDGLTGYMTPFVWMFISSYENLREIIIDKYIINNLIQLEYGGFDGATVPICTFTLRKKHLTNVLGTYIRLSDFKGSQNQAPKTKEAIRNNNCGWLFKTNQKDFKKIIGSPIGYWLSIDFLKIFENNESLISLTRPYQGMASSNNLRFLKFWFEVSNMKFVDNCSTLNESLNNKKKWYPYNKGGNYRKWYGNYDYVVNWFENGKEIKSFVNELNKTKPGGRLKNQSEYLKQSLTWSALTAGSFGVRLNDKNAIFDVSGSSIFPNDKYKFLLLGILNSKITASVLNVLNPTLNYQVIDIGRIPIINDSNNNIDDLVKNTVLISKTEWNSKEYSWDFIQNELIRMKGQDFEETYDLYQQYWKNKFLQLHKNEVELNRQFIEIYGLQEDLNPDVPLEDITILKEEIVIENGQLVFKASEVFAQFMSYAVGCMFGRYSLDKEGLIFANQGETLEDYLTKVAKSKAELSFLPDVDNIIPVLDDEWFEDDIVGRFYAFLKASFGTANFDKNLAFVEECLGKDVRKYFVKDFYADHIKRYKKRPIYWMFSSPKGSFNVLIYMHRYTPDTLSEILNGYLIEYREKLNTRMEYLDHLIVSGTSSEQTKASKEKDKLKLILIELKEYEREILYPLATERIAIDLDDGVLVNYNKFGKAVKEVSGLNDKATKKKVKEFDWIDVTEIR
jgi:type II restriction/modification system DNA methylase subunit YeeA